jgi:hypothetical protein
VEDLRLKRPEKRQDVGSYDSYVRRVSDAVADGASATEAGPALRHLERARSTAMRCETVLETLSLDPAMDGLPVSALRALAARVSKAVSALCQRAQFGAVVASPNVVAAVAADEVSSMKPRVSQPPDAAAEPSNGHAEPSNGHAEPSNGHAEPSSGHAEPSSGHAEPSSGHAEPSSGDAASSNGDAEPANGDAEPSNGDAEPSNGHADPVDRRGAQS